MNAGFRRFRHAGDYKVGFVASSDALSLYFWFFYFYADKG